MTDRLPTSIPLAQAIYTIKEELSIKELKFRRGVLLSAQLGKGNKGVRYVLRRAPEPKGWMQRLSPANRSG